MAKISSTQAPPVIDYSYTYSDAGNRVAASVDGDKSTFTLDNMIQISSYAVNNNSVAVAYDDHSNMVFKGNKAVKYYNAHNR